MNRAIFCFLVFFLYSTIVFSQDNKEEILNNISILEDQLDKTFSEGNYNTLKNLYYLVGENKDAEKLIKKAIKKNPSSPYYPSHLVIHYKRIGENKKADKEFEKVLLGLKNNTSNISLLINYYVKEDKIDYAIKIIKQGQEILKNPYAFIYELSLLYIREDRFSKAIEEYLNLLNYNPNSLNQIKIYLSNILQSNNDKKYSLELNKEILKRVQKDPNNKAMTYLYLWLLLQEKDYKMAFLQAKAVDKRFEQESGETMFEIANIALNNKDYNEAKDAFSYIIAKGEENNYYVNSLIGRLNCLYEPFISLTSPNQKEIERIKAEYQNVLSVLGKNTYSVKIMYQYAFLLAYYLSSPQEAVDLLDEIISMKTINKEERAESKLLRADIYLMYGDIWEASLTYLQVEKDFKNDVLGSQAKFRNAMLSYYNGDFPWANSQFDALRSSTTKLIANDAMKYSMLISDNIDEDSSYNGLSIYSKAEMLVYQNKLKKATSCLDSLQRNYLYHPLFDEVLYLKSQIAIKENDYLKAEELLNEILIKYPTDLMADDALFLLAKLQEEHFLNKEKAKQYYERIILEYPSSLFVAPARERYNSL